MKDSDVSFLFELLYEFDCVKMNLDHKMESEELEEEKIRIQNDLKLLFFYILDTLALR
jgi:hypothetical protein